MTLELKDICGYLPYGVKVYLDGKSYTVTKWKMEVTIICLPSKIMELQV